MGIEEGRAGAKNWRALARAGAKGAERGGA